MALYGVFYYAMGAMGGPLLDAESLDRLVVCTALMIPELQCGEQQRSRHCRLLMVFLGGVGLVSPRQWSAMHVRTSPG